MELLLRLRDREWTLGDYYWRCQRKRSARSLLERSKFRDAVVIMDFRRATEKNPEKEV